MYRPPRIPRVSEQRRPLGRDRYGSRISPPPRRSPGERPAAAPHPFTL